MTTNTQAAGKSASWSTAPTHNRTTTVLHLAGHQLPVVRTHGGTVYPEVTTTSYGVRTLSVTLAGVLIYCGNRAVVDEIATLWESACQHLTALPVGATPQVRKALHPQTDAGASITTAVTFHDVPGLGKDFRRDDPPTVTVGVGPLTVVLHDRIALADTRNAWSYAREAATRHWARERIRSDWDHVT